jgi:hypothetical protein
LKLWPPALKKTDPSILLPFALFGVLNKQEATPLDDFAPPLTFVFPIVAAQAIPVGFTGDPPFVTRTEATTVEPAFGFAGETLTALAATEAPGTEPPAGDVTTTVTDDALSYVSGSDVEDSMTCALSV